MAQLPRGIDPALLLSQVKNTIPYLFDEGLERAPLGSFEPGRILRAYASAAPERLSHVEYFKLCVSAHYSTCATPVPTDVDNQIRQKLWPAALPLGDALEMAEFVLASRKWDFTLVTARFTHGVGDWAGETVSGHLGEWFTIACGAYCALKQYEEPEAAAKRQELFENISDEVRRHSELFASLWRAKEGLGCLKASASLAHNFGDLDRVMDMWELDVGDPLRLQYYKLGATPFDTEKKLRYLGRLWVAGELYKSPIDGSSMALENHRHYALRKPRSLRRARSLLITTGPFFDEWGQTVARELQDDEDALDVWRTLLDGWDRQPKTLGYARAMRGMQEIRPELELAGLKRLDEFRRRVQPVSSAAFERRWADEALRLMDEIPSRA